jgi:hypothetical protein
VIVWPHEHPRPHDWWYRRPSERPREVVNRSVQVWHPRSHGELSDRERQSRGWPAVSNRPATEPRPVAVPSRPVEHAEARRPEERPVTKNREVHRPAPTSRPAEHAAVEPRPVVRSEPQPRPPQRVTPEPATHAAHPAAAPAARPASGALIGVESATETRAYSQRGQQSRQTVSRPAPAATRNTAAAPIAPARTATAPATSGERNRR